MELNRFYLNLIRRWLWLLVLAPLVASAASYWVTKQQPAAYEATARLLVGPGIDSPNPDLNALRTGGQLMLTYAEIATTAPFLQAVTDDLQLDLSAGKLRRQIDVKSNTETQVLSIHVADGDPKRAVLIANAIADRLVKVGPNNAVGSSAELIKTQMDQEAGELQAIVDSARARIAQLEPQVQATENGAITDPVVQGIIDKTQASLIELEAQLQIVTDLQKQRLVFDQIVEDRNRLEQIQRNALDQHRLLVDQLSQERTRLADAHRSLVALYTTLQSTTTNQIELIEPATTGTPVASQVQLIILLAGVAGLILALTVALVFEYFNDTFRTAEELAQAVGAPVLGSIRKHRAWLGARHEPLLIRRLPASRVAEDYRLLGTKLLFSNQKYPSLRAVLISSSQGDDNTSEIAANVAVTLAQTGNRVILVDADLRRPVIGQLFGIMDRPGLTDALMNPSQPPELVQIEWVPGLSILPSDSVLSQRFELLASPRMVNLIAQLKEQADILIIATSPLLTFADSLILASHVDAVLLVTRSGVTHRKVVHHAMDTLRALGAHVTGTVLNDSRRTVVRAAPRRRAGNPVSRLSGNAPAIETVTLVSTGANGSNGEAAMAHQPANPDDHHPATEDASSQETVTPETVTLVSTGANGSNGEAAMAHQPANSNDHHPATEDASSQETVTPETVTLVSTGANGSNGEAAMAHQPADPDGHHPATEDVSSQETVTPVPTAEGETNADSPLSRPPTTRRRRRARR